MTKKAEIYYFRFPNCKDKAEKLRLIDSSNFKDLPFDRIFPDKNHNWINQTDNDFESLMPVCDKQVKLGKSQNAIFKLFSNGVATNRDDWVYDFSEDNLEKKMRFFFDEYNKEVDRWENWKTENSYKEITDESNPVLDNFLAEKSTIKWSKMLKRDKLRKHKKGEFEGSDIKPCFYRPFVKSHIYNGYIPIDVKGEFSKILVKENKIITTMGDCSGKSFFVLSIDLLPDLNFVSPGAGGTRCFPLYVYDKPGNRHDNITNWAWTEFKTHYACELTKTDIFHYVYAVLHHPVYREKYEQNLKREFPRVPFYDDF
ncbi:MAG: type ISP restriction/modification enzyme, partial [Methylococcaceae bacterium]